MSKNKPTNNNKETKENTTKGSTTKEITKKMNIGEIAMNHPETMEVFVKYGMHCIGCAAAHFENLEQGCEAHGIDADAMVKDMNKAISKGKEKKED